MAGVGRGGEAAVATAEAPHVGLVTPIIVGSEASVHIQPHERRGHMTRAMLADESARHGIHELAVICSRV